ncbi:penicillin-binding protein [Alphaproteobacteria bacterium]|nr:penicillin-binding protein [Alphaproteobacteria bacterium]
MPNLNDLSQKSRKPSVVINANNDARLAVYGELYSNYIEFNSISPNLINAVIAIEDNRFYSHPGIDIKGILRAVYVNLLSASYKQGGSTITQQLSKLIFLNSEKSILRKIRELFITLKLEAILDKEEIISLYLNRAYFGSGNYGISAATDSYFSKIPKELSLYEAAILAAALKSPSRLNMLSSPDKTKKRASIVLNRMLDIGLINKNEFILANSNLEKLIINKIFTDESRYFSDWILRRTSKNYNDVSDIIIKTTLDHKVQSEVEKAVLLILKERKDIEAAVIVLDTSGAVKGMLGGRSFYKSQFNRATQSLRQPGSVFKIFTYLSALELGMDSEDKIEDLPLELDGWVPKNYNKKYKGVISIKEAFSISSNVAAVRLQEISGRNNVIKWAKKLGVSSTLKPERSLSLGTQSVSLIEMTNAFAAVASGGVAPFIHGVDSISDRKGNLIYKRQSSKRDSAISKRILKEIKILLKNSMDNGTSSNAKAFLLNNNILYGGKTGTTQNSKDAWFIGYINNLIIGVWVGKDDNTKVEGLSGGNQPAKIYREIVRNLLIL